MRKFLVMILVAAMACSVFAADAKKDATPSLPAGVTVISGMAGEQPEMNRFMDDEDAPWIESMKYRYHDLMLLVDMQVATDAEMSELSDICIRMNWPNYVPEEHGTNDNLDQGSTDTLSNCTSAVVIPALAYGGSYSDVGNCDGDNDCSVISASPYNEVFYTFTPSVSGNYFLRAARTGATAAAAAIRVVSGGCCLGAVNVAFSSSTVAGSECAEPTSRVTYARATLVAGVQYWIHVGTSSSTAGITESYEFSMELIPCPVNESAVDHSTCGTAQAITIGDSLLADSATTTTSDWFTFTLTTVDSVRIFVGARERGHCVSGLYPGSTSLDGRFTLWDGACTTRLDSVDDEGCSFDAVKAYCLNPGTYYIRVFNYSVLDYVLTTASLGPCTTNPVDCNTLHACDVPTEIEPNGACADAGNIIELSCETHYYGVLCPGTERDYWYVGPTSGSQQKIVILQDGDGCSTYPPTILGMRIATTSAGLCTTPSGSFAGGFAFGGCTPWPGGWIAVDRAAASGQSAYKLTTFCTEYACPCPDVVGAQVAQIQGTCLGKIPFGAGLSSGPSSFFFNVAQQYQITDLDVCLAITHTWDEDLDVYLITPWADTLTLFEDVGTSGDNFYVTTLDDEAATPIASGTAPFNGSYIPAEALSGADGFNALGIWELYIVDDTGGDSGYVHCVSLNIGYDVILAAELSSFSAVAGDGNVTLNWATASESNNESFLIERDGQLLTSVAATNNATGANYSWTDNAVVNGTTYSYSLSAVDISGNRVLLQTVEATPRAVDGVISEYALYQNYPNPFNPTTTIAFDLVEAGAVKVTVYNLMGQEVATLVNGTLNAGHHSVAFDATGLSSGLYLYKMEANGFSAQHKMLLLK
ncbi:MAG: T9SS type A sorting domain-containing protein [Calditrichaeota bacterium]|nr:T9SS type A sorting domain-containing protein [Calditrichota bacterium]MCB9365663.1 T9SS type A sorting domain-containing protein [Calditrichota bacterium]MCB9391950.1 T9SS type A sorting domain-containing protein [Calditrichota bacterium]